MSQPVHKVLLALDIFSSATSGFVVCNHKLFVLPLFRTVEYHSLVLCLGL